MFRSGLLVMVITMVSRVLGLVRATIIAYYFGASGATNRGRRERKRIYIFYIESYLCFQYYCNTFNDNIFSGYNKSYSKWIPSRNKDIGI